MTTTDTPPTRPGRRARSEEAILDATRDLLAEWADLVSGTQALEDVGDTREEMRAFVEPVIAILRSPLPSNVIRGLTSEIAQDPDLSRTYRERIIQPRVDQLAALVSRGVERGDLRSDTDVRLAHEMLIGPVLYRLLYSGQPLDDGLGSRIVEAVLRAFPAG